MTDMQSFKRGLSLPLRTAGEYSVLLRMLRCCPWPRTPHNTQCLRLLKRHLGNIFGRSDDAPQRLVSLQLLCKAMGTLCANTSNSVCAAALALCRILSPVVWEDKV